MLRFTIRDLLWLILIGGGLLAWWVDSRNLAEKTVQLQREVRELVERYRTLDNL